MTFYSEVDNSKLLTRPGHGLKPFIFALKQTHHIRYAYFKLISTKNTTFYNHFQLHTKPDHQVYILQT